MRLLFFAGSTREGSYNKKLARLAQHIATANGIEGVFVDLKDYPMPLYHGDLEANEGPPQKAAEFKALLAEYQGVFIATPEYNSSIPALLKNTIDWVTRVRAKGETGLEVYKTRVFAISGASPGYYGAMRSLLTLRQILEVGVGATVIPQQLALPRANDAFEAGRQPQGQGAADHAEGRRGEARHRRQEVRRVMAHARDRLIVALDVPGAEQARALIDVLQDSVGVYKIGLELLFAGGMALASELASRGNRVFIDAKLLDIEATVERATASIARTGAEFLTVHALDCKTLDAAVRGRARQRTQACSASRCSPILTATTSRSRASTVRHRSLRSIVQCWRRRPVSTGSSPPGRDAAALRQALGPKMLIVTPGIRPEGGATQDQARVATPASAIAAGADYLVVGRPITAAPDPRAAARRSSQRSSQLCQANSATR